jgi:FkbM family methyltransferase
MQQSPERNPPNNYNHLKGHRRCHLLGESRLFKVAFALNMAIRRSQSGSFAARFAYWLWENIWDLFFALRAKFHGHSAEFKIFDKRVIMDLRDPSITRALYVFHEYEPLQTGLLLRLLEPGMTFVDIGANTGYYTLLAAKVVAETGRVIAFEPYPGNLELLKKNINLNKLGNVTIEELAISDNVGEALLYLSTINEGDHRIYNGQDDDFYNLGRKRKTIHIKTTSLDHYLNERDIGVDFIKMDLQGAEHIALNGMRNILTTNHNVVILTEYWPHGLERCGSDPYEFLTDLNGLGFQFLIAGNRDEFKKLGLDEVYMSVVDKDSVSIFASRRDL